MMSWDSNTGIGNSKDWFIRLIKGIWELNAIPISNAQLNFTPINNAVKAICELAIRTVHKNKIFHILNTNYLSWTNFLETIYASVPDNLSPKILEKLEQIKTPLELKLWFNYVQHEIEKAQKMNNHERLATLSSLLMFQRGIPTDKIGEGLKANKTYAVLSYHLRPINIDAKAIRKFCMVYLFK